jgi:hypothetical protein
LKNNKQHKNIFKNKNKINYYFWVNFYIISLFWADKNTSSKFFNEFNNFNTSTLNIRIAINYYNINNSKWKTETQLFKALIKKKNDKLKMI